MPLLSSDEAPDERHGSSEESTDEFDKEMDKELMSKIKALVSPSIAQAINIGLRCETVDEPEKKSSLISGSYIEISSRSITCCVS